MVVYPTLFFTILVSTFVSSADVEPSSKPGFSHSIETKNKIYYVAKKPASFLDAHAYCREHGTHLSTITSTKETDAVEKLLKTAYPKKFVKLWIGASRLGGEQDYYWLSTGKVVTYTNFGPGEPNNLTGTEDCLEIRKKKKAVRYTWNDWVCERTNHFICELVHC